MFWFGFRLVDGLGLGCCIRFASIRLGKLATEALHAAGRVDQLLLTRKERVAGSADFQHDIALVRRAGLKVVTARALDGDHVVLRVNSFFWHRNYPYLAERIDLHALAGPRFACNGCLHVTSICLSRRRHPPVRDR